MEDIADFIRFGASRFGEAGLFFGHGTDNAVDEAMALVLHALHLDPALPGELLHGRLTHEEKEQVLDLFTRRINERIPAPYLTGQAWFGGLSFHVDPRVLIPRSPFAECIEGGFSPWLDGCEVRRVLDIGTGSGCMAVALAMVFADATVDAIDISADALQVARRNIHEHGLEDRVHALESDLFSAVKGPYDLITSNPPYVDAAELEAMPPEYHHEPIEALAAGADGLDVVRRILGQAERFLAPNGVLAVEVGTSRRALEEAFPRLPFLWVDLTRGGDNIFIIKAEDLRDAS